MGNIPPSLDSYGRYPLRILSTSCSSGPQRRTVAGQICQSLQECVAEEHHILSKLDRLDKLGF